MKLFFRGLMLLILICVLAAVALGYWAVEMLGSAGPDISVVWDDEVFRWSAPGAHARGWWVLGLTLALICLLVMVPLLLLFGMALPVLLALLGVGLTLAVAALGVVLVLSPLWLSLWVLWRALRPTSPQALRACA